MWRACRPRWNSRLIRIPDMQMPFPKGTVLEKASEPNGEALVDRKRQVLRHQKPPEFLRPPVGYRILSIGAYEGSQLARWLVGVGQWTFHSPVAFTVSFRRRN